jgi:thymidine phosphorylase
LGRASVVLGAGRVTKDAPVDPAVGIEFLPLVGDRLEAGQPVARIHARDEETAAAATAMILRTMEVSDEPAEPGPLVFGWHGADADGER